MKNSDMVKAGFIAGLLGKIGISAAAPAVAGATVRGTAKATLPQVGKYLAGTALVGGGINAIWGDGSEPATQASQSVAATPPQFPALPQMSPAAQTQAAVRNAAAGTQRTMMTDVYNQFHRS